MSADAGLIALAAEMVEPLGPPSHRAMMGGATLYCGGIAYAIVADDALWFKADAETDAAWDAAGAERFTYARKDGSMARMNYARAPDAAHDDADAFLGWARLALAAGQRAAARKRPRRTT